MLYADRNIWVQYRINYGAGVVSCWFHETPKNNRVFVRAFLFVTVHCFFSKIPEVSLFSGLWQLTKSISAKQELNGYDLYFLTSNKLPAGCAVFRRGSSAAEIYCKEGTWPYRVKKEDIYQMSLENLTQICTIAIAIVQFLHIMGEEYRQLKNRRWRGLPPHLLPVKRFL